MQIQILAAVSTLALAAAAGSALADPDPSPPPAAASDSSVTGWYGSLGLARTHTDGPRLDSLEGRIGNRITQSLGAEFEFDAGLGKDHGRPQDAPYGERLNYSTAVYGVAYLPVWSNLTVLGRLGVGDSRFSRNAGGVESHPDYASVNYGVGAILKLNPALDLRADFTRKSYDHNGGDANVWSLALSHRF